VIRTERLGAGWLAAGVAAVLIAVVAGVAAGPVSLAPFDVGRELLDHLPFVEVRSGLTERQAAIVWDLRLPRVVLGLLGTLPMRSASLTATFQSSRPGPV
jgi:iron complex transport system permease protein